MNVDPRHKTPQIELVAIEKLQLTTHVLLYILMILCH